MESRIGKEYKSQGAKCPGTREIKGGLLGRLPYYLVWWLPIAFPSFPPFPIAFGSFDPSSYSFCSCTLDWRDVAEFEAVMMTLLCHRRPLPHE